MLRLDHTYKKLITYSGMSIYNLLEYSGNCSLTSGSLRIDYIDEINHSSNENNDANNYRISSKTTTSKSFEYKTKIKGSTPNNNSRLNAKVVVLLKYLSSIWRYLDLPLINCEIELDLTWSKYCVIFEISRILADETLRTGATCQVNNAKPYVPVVTLSVHDNINILENIKLGFKRTISWNKYRSEITTQSKNNILDYLIDPAFRNINRLFALSFKNGGDDPRRNSVDEFYIPLVETKDFNALINNKPFFDQPVKKK